MGDLRRDNVQYVEEDFQPCGLGRDGIDTYAEKAAESLGFEPGGSAADVVERLGGRLHYWDLGRLEPGGGSVIVHAKWDFDIVLPSYTSPRRDQFTIAHELGHYFLHSAQGAVSIIAHRVPAPSGKWTEWEANHFAAGFLMPRGAFSEACKGQGLSTVGLAAKFNVSPQAAEVRKRVLSL